MTKKYAIILDTNCFGGIDNYNFIESKMVICTGSFKDISNIDVFMPSVVYEELKKHIKDSINESLKQIKSEYLKKGIEENYIKKIYENNVKLLDEFLIKKELSLLIVHNMRI